MKPQHNKWVDNLLNLYIGKVDAIGLDSKFARDTYIETLLDKELIPAIIQGQYSVIFLTGNPGDGKTSFLEKMYDHLIAKGAIGSKDSTGFSLTYQERTYAACYDGAAAHQERKLSADEWLKELFSPFKGPQPPNPTQVVLVAINDGKLHSFFHLPEVREEWPWLSQSALDKAFDPANQCSEDGVLIVNLKERALVDLEIDQDNPESCLFDQLLLLFTDKQHWEICQQCSAQVDCPIFANAYSLGLSRFAKQARTRMKLLFLISHLRRQRHNTMRNIRSALSFAITSNLDCQAIHGASEEVRKQWSNRRYFHMLFSGQDEVLQEFVELDPARMNIAQLDRKLSILFHQGKTDQLRSVLHEDAKMLLVGENSIDWITAIRRQLFFEGLEKKLATELWEVTQSIEFLPYRYLSEFIRHLKQQGDSIALRDKMCEGISRTENIGSLEETHGYLLLRVTESIKEGLIVCKKLPRAEFSTSMPKSELPFVERIPDRIIFKHEPTRMQCVLTLDVFEILWRMAEGQLAESREQQAILDELHSFKSRLHRYQAKDLLLIETNGQIHHITQQAGKIIRQRHREEEIIENSTS